MMLKLNNEPRMPGQAITTYISFEEMAEALELNTQWQFLDPEGEIPRWVRQAAFAEAELYTDDPDSMTTLEQRIVDSIMLHWSPQRIIPSNLDIDGLLGRLNDWGQREPRDKRIFGRVPPSGPAISWNITDTGVFMTIFPAFEIPYVEAYYQLYSLLPDLNLEDLSGYEIFETCYFVEAAEGRQIALDLEHWDEQRVKIGDLLTAEVCY